MAKSKKRIMAQRLERIVLWVSGGIILSVIVAIVALGLGQRQEPGQGIASPAQVQRIAVSDAKALLDQGAALLYDTRSVEEYGAKHARGSISFPEAEQDALFASLPADRDLIFY